MTEQSRATDILITAAVRGARCALRELPAAAVAGISKPVVTCAVEGVLPADRAAPLQRPDRAYRTLR